MSRRDLRVHTGLRSGARRTTCGWPSRVAVPQPVGGAAVPVDDLVVSAASGVRWHGFVEAERIAARRGGSSRVDVDVRGHLSRSRAPGPVQSARSSRDHRERRHGPVGHAPTVAGPDCGRPCRPGALHLRWARRHGERRDAVRRFRVGGLPSLLLHGSAVPQRIPVPWLAAGTVQGATITMHTVRLPSPLGVTPFASAVRSGGPWHRAAGVSADVSLPANPFYGVPRCAGHRRGGVFAGRTEREQRARRPA